MKTDELINLLARDVDAVRPDAGMDRLAQAVGTGALGAGLLMAATLGANPALAGYVALPAFWMKVAFVAALAWGGLLAVQRLSRPGVSLGAAPLAVAIPVLAMWVAAAAVLVPAEPAQRLDAFFGQTWAVCPLLVAMLSTPVFAATIGAMRGLAPTRLRLAGAAAGLLSGSVGALLYCLHCPELAPPFIAFWYLLGVLIPTGAGALLGERLLRW